MRNIKLISFILKLKFYKNKLDYEIFVFIIRKF